MRSAAVSALVFGLATAVHVHSLEAQPLTYRSPNMQGTWVTSPWNLNFAFNHRFRIVNDRDITDIVDDALLKNSPTFNLALGLWAPLMAGVVYSSEPPIRNGTRNNQWYPYLKVAPWRTDRWSVSLMGGWDSQAESIDGELAGQATAGPFELIGAARAFSDALHLGEAGLALAAGAGIHLTRYLLLAADVGGFVAGPDTGVAWSAGIHFAIPFTPHTFSLQVSNALNTTLQGASFNSAEANGGDLVWGFEFTVPFSGFARWGRIFDAGRDDAARAPDVEPARVVEVDIREMRFVADTIRVPEGSAIRWVNRDPVAHTVAADDGSWKSPLVGPAETYTTRPGPARTYAYRCTLHPFMRGAIIVEPRR